MGEALARALDESPPLAAHVAVCLGDAGLFRRALRGGAGGERITLPQMLALLRAALSSRRPSVDSR